MHDARPAQQATGRRRRRLTNTRPDSRPGSARQRHLAVAADEVVNPPAKRGMKAKTETKTSCLSHLLVFG